MMNILNRRQFLKLVGTISALAAAPVRWQRQPRRRACS